MLLIIKRTKKQRMRPSFFHHLHPPTIPAPQARFRYTLGAGGLSVYLLGVVSITGILEMFYYIPTPDLAGNSIQTITFLVPFGDIMRNLHFWSAQLLVIAALVHLLRVVFTGAYAPPRRFNYLLGMVLFVFILFLNFTGYILRWDEGVRWALVTGANLIKFIPLIGDSLYILVMGGSQPGVATLIRFYTLHIFALMVLLVIIAVWHIFRVRRDGGIAAPPPKTRDNQQRITRFELVKREVLAIILSTIVLLILAMLFPAPLAAAMSESNLQVNHTKAPWFFLWIQQLLHYGDPFWMGVFIPGCVFLIFLLLPYLPPNAQPYELGGWLPRHARKAQLIAACLFLVIFLLTILAVTSE